MACLEIVASASVDCVICDPPYGTTQNKWDVVIDIPAMWRELTRVCRGAIVLTASQPFTSMLVASRLDMFRYAWVWEKSNATGHLNVKRMPMKLHEDVLVFSQGATTYNPQGLTPFNKITRRGNNGTNFGKSGTENFQEFTNYPRSILRFANDSKPSHPTQKPLALMEYLVATYSNAGDLVLDFACGAGTTALVAHRLGRRSLNFEINPDYVAMARARLKAEESGK